MKYILPLEFGAVLNKNINIKGANGYTQTCSGNHELGVFIYKTYD